MMLANLSLAPALQAVGWALLHLVWQGTAIAVSTATTTTSASAAHDSA